MNLARMASLEAWKGIALEAAWKIGARPHSHPSRETWPLDRDLLNAIAIEWPTTYKWPLASKWVESIRRGLAKYVRIKQTDIPQHSEHIVMARFLISGQKYDVAIDYSDYPEIDEDCARKSWRYFKMQFSHEGYGTENVIPGGFIPFQDNLYKYLARVRELADRRSYLYEVYGRFGLEFAGDIRRKACEILASQNWFGFEGSLRVRRYCISLREIAHSKICIDLPGNGDFCFRLIDYLAVGSCIIGVKHRTQLPSPLVDGTHIVYVKDDLSDLVDVCRHYLENEEARQTLRRNARAYFDRYLHREQLAGYYLSRCLEPV